VNYGLLLAIVDEVPVDPAPAKLLLIEDDAGVRRFMEQALRNRGYVVDVAADGVQGLQLMQTQPREYRLVILDLVLPWMNGLEVLGEMRRRPDTKLLPVLVTTGSIVTPGEFTGDARVSVLPKPFNTLQLSVAVEQMLRKYSAD
jgi:DNA-binding response OmpR family regulator